MKTRDGAQQSELVRAAQAAWTAWKRADEIAVDLAAALVPAAREANRAMEGAASIERSAQFAAAEAIRARFAAVEADLAVRLAAAVEQVRRKRRKK